MLKMSARELTIDKPSNTSKTVDYDLMDQLRHSKDLTLKITFKK